jgi:membrane protease YdiL (CAAX protease family)
MLADSLFTALVGVLFVLWLLLGTFIYVALIHQIRTRTDVQADVSTRTFGLPEAIVAALLMSFLLLNVIVSISRPISQLSTGDLATNLALTLFILFILVGFLRLRGLDVAQLGGFSRIGLTRAVTTGAVLLLATWPLLSFAEVITRRFFGGGSSKQNIIEFFNTSQTIEQRIMIIILAVAIAPIVEEFLFRFFLYGVFKRYFGVFLGLTINALLFAAAHTHMPSFAPLFVLGACFTIAYEWSGSLLVSMAMHSLFNAIQLTFLAFPEVFQQLD